jgi:hypothetical protein
LEKPRQSNRWKEPRMINQEIVLGDGMLNALRV